MQENNPSYPFIATLLPPSGIIIDNGCGRNEFKQSYGPKIYGLDLNYHPSLDLLTDGKKLPFKDHAIDVFLSNFVLEHVENPELYLQEMKRCLSFQGKIILSIPRPLWYFSYFLSPSVWIKPFKNPLAFLKHPLRFFTHGHPHKHSLFYELFEWREKNYRALFLKTGFSIQKKYSTCNFLSLNKRYAKIFGKLRLPDFLNVHTTFILRPNPSLAQTT